MGWQIIWELRWLWRGQRTLTPQPVQPGAAWPYNLYTKPLKVYKHQLIANLFLNIDEIKA